MKILLIEDEPELSKLGKQQMELLGHEVVSTATLQEAQQLWESQGEARYNIVITDHRLPDGRGIDFVIDLRENYPKLKCAVVSGCLTLTDRQLLKLYNIPYFLKPVLYSSVLKELRKPPSVLTQKGEEAPAQTPQTALEPQSAESTNPTQAVETASADVPKAAAREHEAPQESETKGQFEKFLKRFKKS